ncbi:hypothetical protein M0E87_04365 [Corynebacterium sp. CCM 9185]|uniref:hypothetical protein n=1 Tax=Corynebacterium marambiense TaxID=2765364 RepID=UPI001E310AA7|nr:hypothetical protein [Corynebacterium marambiense]MCK7662899.1 hypothetical protein [Corynebacterium marambiense]
MTPHGRRVPVTVDDDDHDPPDRPHREQFTESRGDPQRDRAEKLSGPPGEVPGEKQGRSPEVESTLLSPPGD